MQSVMYDDSQARINLQMIADSKDAEIERLQARLRQLEALCRQELRNAIPSITEDDAENQRLEGYLSIPNKQNIRRHGWRKQYVVVSSRKIIFYNSEADKAKADPVLILDLSKLFHVRSVTQGDVIRADVKEISRIFQLLYAGEGESRRPVADSLDSSLKEVTF